MTDRLRLRISPCPNDTFMFEALLNGRIPTQGLAFEVGFQDIEELNEGVSSPDGPDISKISYAVLPAVVDRYALLDSGSALGRGNGQLLVRRRGDRSPIRRVAIPGELTTANAMLLRFFPSIVDRTPVLFSEIAAAVERGAFDAGVLIHEGRFTYERHNLELVADLGAADGTAAAVGRHRGESGTAGGGASHLRSGIARQHRLRARTPDGVAAVRQGTRSGVGRRGDRPSYRALRQSLFACIGRGGASCGARTDRTSRSAVGLGTPARELTDAGFPPPETVFTPAAIHCSRGDFVCARSGCVCCRRFPDRSLHREGGAADVAADQRVWTTISPSRSSSRIGIGSPPRTRPTTSPAAKSIRSIARSRSRSIPRRRASL